MPYSDGIYTPPAGVPDQVPGNVIRSVTWNTAFADIADALTDIGQGVTIEWTIRDFTAGAITTGVKGFLEIPMALTINSWRLMADQVGSIVVDVWVAPFASFPPTVANTITGSAKPTITSAQSAGSSTLTGWTTSVAKNAIMGFNVSSISTIQQVTLSLVCGRN